MVSKLSSFLWWILLFSQPPDVPTARNVGLTRAFLDWEVRWDNVSSDIHEVIDGFMVFVYPDQKSSEVLVPEGGFGFVLPKFVQVKIGNQPGRDYKHSRVDGFSVGGLGYYPNSSSRAKIGSDSLVSDKVWYLSTDKVATRGSAH